MTFGFGFGFGNQFGRRGGGGFGWGAGRYGGWTPQQREFEGRPDADRSSLHAIAEANGWMMLADLPPYADGSTISIDGGPFAPGYWQVRPPVVIGRAGYWEFIACTVDAKTRGGNWQSNAVTMLKLPGDLPYIHVYPENWRLQATAVVPEVHLESGAFNDKFSVFSDSARTVYQILSPRAMQALLDAPPLDELWTCGPHVIMARIDPHNPTTLNHHLHLLTTIADGVPSSAWGDGDGAPDER